MLAIVLSSFRLSAQTVSFNIQGTLKNTETAKFAYVSTLSQQIPISSPKIFTVAPIVNGSFQLNGKLDLEGKPYQNACLFIDERGNISKEELASKFKELIWVTGRDSNLKEIIIEDMKIEVEERDKMNHSKIRNGGILTKQLEEKNLAIRQGNRKLLDFIKTHSDSPVSFVAVQENTSIFDSSRRDRYESRYGLPSELFMLLSERLKNSKAGLALKQEIDEKYKP